jgi:hypothetical protein
LQIHPDFIVEKNPFIRQGYWFVWHIFPFQLHDKDGYKIAFKKLLYIRMLKYLHGH